jgi:hypothetical protein
VLKVDETGKSLIVPGKLLVRRDYGTAKRLKFLQPLSNESSDQRLMAAILRGDKDVAMMICRQWRQSKTSSSLERFCLEVTWGNLPVLIYERCLFIGLAESLAEVMVKDDLSLLDFLRERAAAGVVESKNFSQRFEQLLVLVSDLANELIWLKGTSLSRLIYQRPEQRLSFDFDLLVSDKAKTTVFDRLIAAGFSAIWDQPGFCHQIGVGPVDSLQALFLLPNKECEGCHNLTLSRSGYPYVELKFNPLDTGLKMKEQQRFFQDRIECSFPGKKFCAPSYVDHLLLELSHLHKHGFQGWAWLYDIHLLASGLDGGCWREFIRRSQLEGIETSAWLGLAVVCDRLNTDIPDFVFAELKPKHMDSLVAPLLPAISMEFLWNCNSLPMLLLNAAFIGDSKRKYKVLQEVFFPNKEFLANYYAYGKPITWWNYWYYLLINWLIIIFPAGLIRRTIGPLIWRRADNSPQVKNEPAADHTLGTM